MSPRAAWLLIVPVLLVLGGQIVLWGWYVEDAAISFAYARNLAEGWGLTRFPGDARVEGYSNPLWVFLLAGWHVLGADPFQSSRVMAVLLGIVAVCSTYAGAVRGGIDRRWALLPALLLACDAQFQIWSASGLENALFCALLALGTWRTLAEAEDGGFAWASLCFLGLALTRPEGIVYAAFGGLLALVLEAVGKRRFGRIAVWLVVFWVPFAVYHAIRFSYFAYEFPATYYAKLGEARFNPWFWNHRGWTYLRSFAFETGRGFLLPLFLIGGLGLRGWRGVTAGGLCAVLAVLLLYPGVEPLLTLGWPGALPTPSWWVALRVVMLGLVAFAVPVMTLGSRRWRLRLMCWGMALIALLFCIRSTGDWMRGFRWLSLCSVPAAGLLGLAVVDLWEAVSERSIPWRGGMGALLAGLLTLAIVPEVVYFARYQPEVGPFSVKRRLDHYRWAMRKLKLERVRIVDHDMGAMLYWSGTDSMIIDARGLIDYPFALHRFDRRFVEPYLWGEYPFDIAHAHASTGRAVKPVRRWRSDYVEFPGYGRGPHGGNFVRRNLLATETWEGPTGRVARFDGATLYGPFVRAPEVAIGSFMYLELGLSLEARARDGDYQVFVALTRGDTQIVHEVPLGLGDWLPITEWKPGEVGVSRVSVKIPHEVPAGDYALSVVVLGPDGVLSPLASEGFESSGGALYAEGELRSEQTIRIWERKAVKKAARKDIKRSIAHSEALKCEQAESAWTDARAHFMESRNWQESVRSPVYDGLARCFALRAETAGREAAVADIRRARWWDRTHPVVLRVGAELGARWYAEASDDRALGDIETARAGLQDALYADPSLSWARRELEAIRFDEPVR